MGLLPLSFYFSLPYYYLKYRVGGPFFGDLDKELFGRGFPELKDKSVGEIEKISLRGFEKGLINDIFPQALELIRDLRMRGRKVLLATSSIDIIIRPVAEYLGVDDIIATRLEFINGICTGRFLSAPLFGEEKKRRVVEYVESLDIALDNCAFYSDSFHDLPLLEAVGRPVAVNPDKRLRKIARRRNWDILRLH
jgi:HAD superfamily hydrolase (TIGR01490 family)